MKNPTSVDNLVQELVSCHKQYNENRRFTSTEKCILESKEQFTKANSHINFERSEKANYHTFCAHGTNAFVLFLVFAFANAKLLPGNARKLTGVPRISGESEGKSPTNSNFVSAYTLSGPGRCYLVDAYSYTRLTGTGGLLHINNKKQYNDICDYILHNGYVLSGELYKQKCNDAAYETLKGIFLSKYRKRSNSKYLLQSLEKIFSNPLMSEICVKLLNTTVVILGEGIGKNLKPNVHTGEMELDLQEVLYEAINTRCVIVDKEIQKYLKDLIDAINPKMAKDIAWFNKEEIEVFVEQWNNQCYYNMKDETLKNNCFLDKFEEKFRSRLPFMISRDFSSVSVEKDLLHSYSAVYLCKGACIPEEAIGNIYNLEQGNSGYLTKKPQLQTDRRSIEYFHLHEQTFKATGETIIEIGSNIDYESENLLMPTQSQGSSPPMQIPTGFIHSSANRKSLTFLYGSLLLSFLVGMTAFSIILAMTYNILLAVFCGSVAGVATLFFNKPSTELDNQHVKHMSLHVSGKIEV